MRYLFTLVLALAVSLNAAFAQDGEEHGPMIDGGIVHIEIPTTDMAATEEFYATLFGWESEPMMEGYHGFSTPDGVAGAFSSMIQPSENGPVLYIYCADIDSKLPEIEAAGGTVAMGRTPIPGVGWFALFVDTSGNVLGLFSAEDAPAGDMSEMGGNG